MKLLVISFISNKNLSYIVIPYSFLSPFHSLMVKWEPTILKAAFKITVTTYKCCILENIFKRYGKFQECFKYFVVAVVVTTVVIVVVVLCQDF